MIFCAFYAADEAFMYTGSAITHAQTLFNQAHAHYVNLRGHVQPFLMPQTDVEKGKEQANALNDDDEDTPPKNPKRRLSQKKSDASYGVGRKRQRRDS